MPKTREKWGVKFKKPCEKMEADSLESMLCELNKLIEEKYGESHHVKLSRYDASQDVSTNWACEVYFTDDVWIYGAGYGATPTEAARAALYELKDRTDAEDAE